MSEQNEAVSAGEEEQQPEAGPDVVQQDAAAEAEASEERVLTLAGFNRAAVQRNRRFKRVERAQEWVEYFALRERAHNALSVFCLNDFCRSLRFLITPFGIDSCPIYMLVSDTLLKPISCKAATQAIDATRGAVAGNETLRILTEPKRVWKKAVANYSAAKKYVQTYNESHKSRMTMSKRKDGRINEYVDTPPFVEVQIKLVGNILANDAEDGLTPSVENTNAGKRIVQSLANSAGYFVNRIAATCNGFDRERLCREFGLSSMDQLVQGERILGLLWMTMPWDSADPRWANRYSSPGLGQYDTFVRCFDVAHSIQIDDEAFNELFGLLAWVPPLTITAMYNKTGCWTCMPTESGWGWLSAVSPRNERAVLARGDSNLSLWQMCELCWHDVCTNSGGGHPHPFRRDGLLHRLCVKLESETEEDYRQSAISMFQDVRHRFATSFKALFSADFCHLFYRTGEAVDGGAVVGDRTFDDTQRDAFNAANARADEVLSRLKANQEARYDARRLERLDAMREELGEDNPRYRLRNARYNVRVAARPRGE